MVITTSNHSRFGGHFGCPFLGPRLMVPIGTAPHNSQP
jgi:hypothetical protein